MRAAQSDLLVIACRTLPCCNVMQQQPTALASALSELGLFDDWRRAMGISNTTAWRYRRRGLIKTVNICGRLYVARSAIREFESRALSGEFERAIKTPRALAKQTR